MSAREYELQWLVNLLLQQPKLPPDGHGLVAQWFQRIQRNDKPLH